MNTTRLHQRVASRWWASGATCLAGVLASAGATYHVAPSGSNGASGSSETPWRTISYAASRCAAGDTVRVHAGTYNERIPIAARGASNAWINFVADGQAIVRAFDLNGASYVRIIGFELTHTDTSWGARPINIVNGSSYIELLDNNIHDVFAGATEAVVYGQWNSHIHHITIRGNRIFYVNHVTDGTDRRNYGIASPNLADHWLVEYNTLARVGDYINTYGTNHIIRNNALTDHLDSYWTTGNEHSDIFQPGSDGQQNYCRHHIYENNFAGDNLCRGGTENSPNGHFALFQDISGYGDTNMVLRGNAVFNFSDGAIGIVGAKKISTYNNTFHGFYNALSYAQFVVFRSTANPTLNGLAANSIFSILDGSTERDKALLVEPGCTATRICNLGYLTGTDPSFVTTSNPLFVNPDNPARDFHLQSGSPARGAGTNVVWITSVAGSGSTFNVNDAQLLCDGWGMVDGDRVIIGSTSTAVLACNWATNTITVADSVSWTNGQPVYWLSSTRDIGAFPYGSADLTAAFLAQNGTNYTVITTGDARGVWFYVDGIPAIWDSSPPYSASFASGTVTAKAYALYAQAIPVITAINVPSMPVPPFHLRVVQ